MPDKVKREPRDEPTLTARRLCAIWLRGCLSFGWPKESLDELERLWWKHHDNHGELVIGLRPEEGKGK
jgi:hypothetical protein